MSDKKEKRLSIINPFSKSDNLNHSQTPPKNNNNNNDDQPRQLTRRTETSGTDLVKEKFGGLKNFIRRSTVVKTSGPPSPANDSKTISASESRKMSEATSQSVSDEESSAPTLSVLKKFPAKDVKWDKISTAKEDKKSTLPRLKGSERFVNYFFSIGISQNLEPVNIHDSERIPILQHAFKGEVLECFPDTTEDDPFPPHLWMFCFPSGIKFVRSKLASICFPFVLTGGTGTKLYAYSLVFWEKVTNPKILLKLEDPPYDLYLPRCIGVVSHYPYFNIFQEFLREVFSIYTGKSNTCLEDLIINFTMKVPLPPPRNVEVKFYIGPKPQTITFPEESQFPLGVVPLHYIFKSLGSANVVKLFVHLLLEHKVLFTCHNYTLLTFVCEGLRLLLQPFDWPHVFVPVLPEFLIDFVYSPTPFILGVFGPNLTPLIRSEIQDEVIIVDIEKSTVHIPECYVDQPVPEPDTSLLIEQLTHFFYSDLASMDSPQFNPYTSDPKSKRESGQEVTNYLRCAFLRYLLNFFGSYQEYLLYLRVFPSPVSMFDTTKFLKTQQNKDPKLLQFFEEFTSTQVFQCFLESYNSPKEKIFNVWMRESYLRLPFDDLVRKVSVKRALPEVIQVPPPASNPKAVEYETFPTLDTELLEKGQTVSPLKVSNRNSVAPPNKTQSILRHDTFVRSTSFVSFKPDIPSKTSKKVISLMMKLFGENPQPLEGNDEQDMLDMLHMEDGRRSFAQCLVDSKPERQHQKTVPEPIFDQISHFISICLKEAYSTQDFISTQILIPVIYSFNKLLSGTESFFFQTPHIREADVWQSMPFWEKSFWNASAQLMVQLYGPLPKLNSKMESFLQLTETEQNDIINKEADQIFELISEFAFNMVNIGANPELIRRFSFRACSVTGLDEEKTKTMMQLVTNMTRANELAQSSTIPEVKEERYVARKNQGGFIPVGLDKDENNGIQEAISLFQKFIDEKTKVKSSKVAQTLRKNVRHNTGGSTTDRSSQNKEYREDYTIRTLQGHTEGVLCVIADNNIIASGSGDGTIKLWTYLNTSCVATLKDHTGFVNNLQFDDDGHLISSSYDATLKLWDLKTHKKLFSMKGHTKGITCFKFAKEKKGIVVSGSSDNTLHLWDARHHRKPAISFLGHQGAVTCLDLKTNYILSGSKDTYLKLWDIRTGKSIKTLTGHSDWVKVCKFDQDFPNEKGIWSGGCDSKIKRWDAFGASTDATTAYTKHSGMINDIIEYSPGVLVSASADTTVRLWRTLGTSGSESELNVLQSHTDEVVRLAKFQQNLVTASYDSTIKIWDPIKKATPLLTLVGHNYRISDIATYDNHLITASWDKTIKLWTFELDRRF